MNYYYGLIAVFYAGLVAIAGVAVYEYRTKKKAAALREAIAIRDAFRVEFQPKPNELHRFVMDLLGLLRQITERTKPDGDMADAAVHGLAQTHMAMSMSREAWGWLANMSRPPWAESPPVVPCPRMGEPETVPMLSCPFCGGVDIDAEFATDAQGDVQAGCMTCSACGPESHTPQDAALRWNARVGVTPKMECQEEK